MEAKTWAMEEFGEGMVEDYQFASKKIWYTFHSLEKGMQCSANTVHRTGGAGRWKEYFSTAKASAERAEAEDSEVDSSITQAGNLLGMDEILPKYLMSLDVQGLS